MAKLFFTLKEVLEIIEDKVELPGHITEIKIIENKLRVTVKPVPIFPSFDLTMSFNRFEKGKLYMNVKSSVLLKFGLAVFIKHENYKFINFELDKLVIEVNKIISTKINWLRIEDVFFENGLFIVKIIALKNKN